MDGIKVEINRLCQKLYLDVEETSKDFFRVGKTRTDYDMGFRTSTYIQICTGSGEEVWYKLKCMSGEKAVMPSSMYVSNERLTLAEATWITDLLRLPSNRVEDVRTAVTRVMDARRK